MVIALAGECGADVNAKNLVSCVHQPELLLLCGVCMFCTANLYVNTVMMVKCCVCALFLLITHMCCCVALTLLVTAVWCASELGVHQGSMCSESGYMWCSGVAFAL